MTMFGVAALIGPIVGPTLGGWLVVQYDWRYIFYINVPTGLLALGFCYFVVRDPEYLKKERTELRKRPLNFDTIGLGLLALVLASWEIMLSKGQEWDWLGDPFGRIQTLLTLIVVGLACLIFWEMRRQSDRQAVFRVLGEPQPGHVLRYYSQARTLHPVMPSALLYRPRRLSQALFVATMPLASGIVQAPGGFSSIIMMVVVRLSRWVEVPTPVG